MKNLSVMSDMTQTQTMSLKELCDLIQYQRHDNAKRVVKRLQQKQEFGYVIKSSFRTTVGNVYQTYLLNKNQSLIVAAKLNDLFLIKVVERWQQLEKLTLHQQIQMLDFETIAKIKMSKQASNVYIAKCQNLYKIGKADNPIERIKQLQTGNPFKITLVCVIPTINSFELEQLLHKKFKQYHHYGEWYKLKQEHLDWLQSDEPKKLVQ